MGYQYQDGPGQGAFYAYNARLSNVVPSQGSDYQRLYELEKILSVILDFKARGLISFGFSF
jgi:hypothetical protein